MVDIYLRTIPHTGTRFVAAFLEYLGVKYQQWHFGWPEPPEHIDLPEGRFPLNVIPRTDTTRYIVTARNPYHTWESLKFDGRTWGSTCHEWYDEIKSFCESKELVFVLSLDPADRQQALHDLAEFCGVEYDGNFVWEASHQSGCEHGDCPDDVREQLQGAYQWYSHHRDAA